MRNCRPLMETLTWAMAAPGSPSGGLLLIGYQHAADRFDCLVDPLCDLPVGGFEPARPRRRMIEFAGEPRPIGAERVDLCEQCLMVAIEFAAPLGRSLQRIERERQTPVRNVDGIGVVHTA